MFGLSPDIIGFDGIRGMLNRRSIVDSPFVSCRHARTVVNVREAISANTLTRLKAAFAKAFAAPQLAFATA